MPFSGYLALHGMNPTFLKKYLIEIHVLVPKNYDQAVTEFCNFLDHEVKKQQIEFFGFEVKNK